jgi:cyclopropane-fatty-acyl-phospholipid synthase
MLYRFKSQAAAEVVMLKDTGEEMLSLIGKAPQPTGVITVDQLPNAMLSLTLALRASDMQANDLPAPLDDEHPDPARLHQRVMPFMRLLQASAAGQRDVVWGV